jgi:hypothetical protein
MERPRPLSTEQVEALSRRLDAGAQHRSRRDLNATVRNRFPLISAVSMFLRVGGVLAFAVGVVLLVIQVVPWVLCLREAPRGVGTAACGFVLWTFMPAAVAVVVGVGMIAFGELLGIFRAIEGNTHQLLGRIEELREQRPQQLAGE